ncbi:DUF3606 domain-containing protein [Mycoplana dimorpha]|uniref:Uncharacterized protein DUF3606 n=1 Tax=Mycoplana dimorpha TaxID=28320 RepID=A0A2T5AK94_MYCDI|nr:DUF3606 domain-containing protein [Mycoplana dimorpha]PTM87155.1 uncharacterized protein DUF3606 [Mycoplana dimorpha]
MPDDKKAIGRDRQRVAAEQVYEVAYFARKFGLTRDEARDIIKQAGNSRENANDLARDRPQPTR